MTYFVGYHIKVILCVQSSSSALDEQCETLLIKVKNRRIILSLINNTPNFQALNARCEDDSWTNEILRMDDELVEWLRQQLPSTCTIARDTYFVDSILTICLIIVKSTATGNAFRLNNEAVNIYDKYEFYENT